MCESFFERRRAQKQQQQSTVDKTTMDGWIAFLSGEKHGSEGTIFGTMSIFIAVLAIVPDTRDVISDWLVSLTSSWNVFCRVCFILFQIVAILLIAYYCGKGAASIIDKHLGNAKTANDILKEIMKGDNGNYKDRGVKGVSEDWFKRVR